MGMIMKLTVDDHYFEIQDDLLIRCRGSNPINKMPERITRIGKEAFRDCQLEELDLTGTHIRAIEEEAFLCQDSLKKVILPELDRIGADAFRGCENLKTVILTGAVEEIQEQAFMGCRNLEEISFNRTGQIGRWAFMNCESLERVWFSGAVEEIGDEAFFCCRELKEALFSDVGKLGDCVFFECKKLASVHFAGSVGSIGEEAFRNCSALKELVFEQKVEHLGLGAFSYCRNLAEVVMPEGAIDDDSIENGFWTTSYTKAGGLEQHPEGNAPWYLLWKIKRLDQEIAGVKQEKDYLNHGKCPFCGGKLVAKRERLFHPKQIRCEQCGRREEEIRLFSQKFKDLETARAELAETAGDNLVFAGMLEAYEREKNR